MQTPCQTFDPMDLTSSEELHQGGGGLLQETWLGEESRRKWR